jgi:hypothetical protein
VQSDRSLLLSMTSTENKAFQYDALAENLAVTAWIETRWCSLLGASYAGTVFLNLWRLRLISAGCRSAGLAA